MDKTECPVLPNVENADAENFADNGDEEACPILQNMDNENNEEMQEDDKNATEPESDVALDDDTCPVLQKINDEVMNEGHSDVDENAPGTSNAGDGKDDALSAYKKKYNRRSRYKKSAKSDESDEENIKIKRPRQDPNAPKRPRSAYILFLSKRRASFGNVRQGVDQRQINLALGAEWSALNQQDRQEYIELAQKEKEEYERAMAAYVKTNEYQSFRAALSSPQSEGKKSPKKTLEKPAKSSKKRTLPIANGKVKEESPASISSIPVGGVPVFTQEFLEINRKQETDLRNLRREINARQDDLEEKNKIVRRYSEEIERLNEESKNLDEMMRIGDELLELLIDAVNSLPSAQQDSENATPVTSAEDLMELLERVNLTEDRAKLVEIMSKTKFIVDDANIENSDEDKSDEVDENV